MCLWLNYILAVLAIALCSVIIHSKLSVYCIHPNNGEDTIWTYCQIRKLRVAHAPGMPRTFSPPPWVSDPDMHYGTCVTHVPWCMPGSLTSGFLWSRWRRKRSRHSRHMRNPQFFVSGKRPITPTAHKPKTCQHGGAWRSLFRSNLGRVWTLNVMDQ